MRVLLLSAFVALSQLSALETDPAAVLPPDPAIDARIPDLARSRQPWAGTQYPRLMATPWGKVMISEWTYRLGQLATPGVDQGFASITALAAGVAPRPGGQLDAVIAVAGPDEVMGRLLVDVLHHGQHGFGFLGESRQGIMTWVNAGNTRHEPIAPTPIADREGDLVVVVRPQRCAQLAGTPVTPLLTWLGTPTISVSLASIGLREHVHVPASALSRDMAAVTTHWANPAELSALPITTLCALTWTLESRAASVLLNAIGVDAKHPQPGSIEDTLAHLGLPGLAETTLAATGPSVVWMSEGVPFPACNLALAIQQDVAQRWIAGLAGKLNLAAVGDGSFAGHVGLLPVTIGWVAGTTPDQGRLFLTTDPLGLDVWRKRTPGFAKAQTIAVALSEAPSHCIAIGVSRSGASWGTLTQLIVPLFTSMGAPQVMSLPQDLRGVTTTGYLYASIAPEGSCDIRSGGLLGGPATWGSVFPVALQATVWIQLEQLREAEKARPVKPEPTPRTF